VTEAELDGWMRAYGDAYVARDADAGAALFARDATYQWGPFGPLLHGPDAIREEWARGVARMGTGEVTFRHEIVACTEDVGVARWLASLPTPTDGERMEIDGIFVVRLRDDGLCREFREWWNSRTS
jgi:ketosteroid isomerase-like protein